MQNPQHAFLRRKAPSWCKITGKEIIFNMFIMAKKIYLTLIVIYLIFYSKSHHEHYKHGRPQMAFFALWGTCSCLWGLCHWFKRSSLPASLKDFLISPCRWVCHLKHCTALLVGAKACLHSRPNTAGLLKASVLKPKTFLSLLFHPDCQTNCKHLYSYAHCGMGESFQYQVWSQSWNV